MGRHPSCPGSGSVWRLLLVHAIRPSGCEPRQPSQLHYLLQDVPATRAGHPSGCMVGATVYHVKPVAASYTVICANPLGCRRGWMLASDRASCRRPRASASLTGRCVAASSMCHALCPAC